MPLPRFGFRRLLGSLLVATGLAGCASVAPPPAPPPPLDWQRGQLHSALPGLEDYAVLSHETYHVHKHCSGAGPLPPPGVSCHLVPERPRPGDHPVLYLLDQRGPIQVIAIRGTDNWGDARIDLRTRRVPDDWLGVEVHPGFQQVAQAVLGDLRGKGRLDPARPVVVTGHSMGGAAAVLVGLRMLLENDFPDVRVVTFGQPKVFGNDGVTQFARFRDRILRVAHCGDPVTIVPVAESRTGQAIRLDVMSRARLANYEHLGRLLLLMPDRQFWMLEAGDVERPLGRAIAAVPVDALGPQDHEHAILLYGQRLREMGDLSRVVSFRPDRRNGCPGSAPR